MERELQAMATRRSFLVGSVAFAAACATGWYFLSLDE